MKNESSVAPDSRNEQIKQCKKQILHIARLIKAFDDRGLNHKGGYTFEEERSEIKRLENLIRELKNGDK